MTQPTRIPYGGKAPPGRFLCLDCGHEITLPREGLLPPCPLYDSAHSRRSWRSAGFAQPVSGDTPFNRKEEAITLAMKIIMEVLRNGGAVAVESFPVSRNAEEIRRHLEMLYSGAMVTVHFKNKAKGYFDILYKCHLPVAIDDYSDDLKPMVEKFLKNSGKKGTPKEAAFLADGTAKSLNTFAS